MKYSVITKKLAKEDIIKTYSWYEEKRVGLRILLLRKSK